MSSISLLQWSPAKQNYVFRTIPLSPEVIPLFPCAALPLHALQVADKGLILPAAATIVWEVDGAARGADKVPLLHRHGGVEHK